MTHDIHAQHAVEHRKPIIPDDIQNTAREMVASMAPSDMQDDKRHVAAMMLCFAMAAERYRCVDIIEQFDPEIAARLWRNDQ